MKPDEVRTFLEEYYACYNRLDFDEAVTNFYAEDALLESTVMKVRGRTAIAEWFRGYHASVPSRLVPAFFVVDEDRAAVEIRVEFAEGFELPSFLEPFRNTHEGRPVLRMIAVYELKNQKIARTTVYTLMAEVTAPLSIG